MLMLALKENGTVELNTSDGVIVVHISKLSDTRVTLGIDAPQTVDIIRDKLKDKQKSK